MRSIFKCIENTGINKNIKKLKRFVLLRQQPFTVQSQRCLKRETSVICPLSPYAIDKFAAERYVLNEYHLHGYPRAQFASLTSMVSIKILLHPILVSCPF